MGSGDSFVRVGNEGSRGILGGRDGGFGRSLVGVSRRSNAWVFWGFQNDGGYRV